MTGKSVNHKKEENIGWKWIFTKREPTDKQKRQIISRVCENGMRIVFEHFTYQFGGETYIQGDHGGHPHGHAGLVRELQDNVDLL